MLIWANTSKQKIENHLTKSDAKVHFLSAIESTGQNSEHIGLSLIVNYGIINLHECIFLNFRKGGGVEG